MLEEGKLWSGTKHKAVLMLSMYGRSGRISFTKDVVRVLGVPPYVSVRVNPEKSSILVESAESSTDLTFKTPKDICTNPGASLRINSASFTFDLMFHNEMDMSQTYQMYGVYMEKENAVVFDIRDAKLYAPART